MLGSDIHVKQPTLKSRFRRWPTLVALLLFWNGCVLHQSLHEQAIGDFGRFVFHASDSRSEGFVLGVPHGSVEPEATDYANAISNATGAGLVIAYGFKCNRISVAQPLIHSSPISWNTTNSPCPGSVYPQFTKFLRAVIEGPLKLYVGVRIAEEASHSLRIKVASAGFSFEQLIALKHAYATIRNETIKDPRTPRIEIALNPLDNISWNAFGVKNHGLLVLAEKGLILRLPKSLVLSESNSVYRDIITKWVSEASIVIQRGSSGWPPVQVDRSAYGRIDLIPSRNAVRGVVIRAPHGSFDWYTGEFVEELSYRTSLASVVTRGLTPTECGGWRINVNRPTERRYQTDTIERETDRAREVYQHFADTVFEAARGPLDLYIDMHQNSSEPNIEVATLGITRERARWIKTAYRNIRDQVFREEPQTPVVNLIIEPVDQVPIGAWAAKDHGILRLARSSLHFELPAQHVFYRGDARRTYTKILAELIQPIAPLRTESNVAGLAAYSSLQYARRAEQTPLDHDRAPKKLLSKDFRLLQTE